jgi:hypothetical protein
MIHVEISRPAPLPKAGDALPRRDAARKKSKPKRRQDEPSVRGGDGDEPEGGESPRPPLDLLT